MSFGRTRSSDSGPSYNPQSTDLMSRVHYLSRYSKSADRYNDRTSEFGFDGSLLYQPHHQYKGMNTEMASPRSSQRSRAKTSQNRSKDLKRKLVFNLHEEVEKPVHTIILREISDMDTITEMCLETMSTMMRSKVHKKYLYHMNNNCILNSSPYYNVTNNTTSRGKLRNSSFTLQLLKAVQKCGDAERSPENKTREAKQLKGIFGFDVDEIYRKEIAQSRRRKAEIRALRNLAKELPPPGKKSSEKKSQAELTEELQKAELRFTRDSKTWNAIFGDEKVDVDMTAALQQNTLFANILKNEETTETKKEPTEEEEAEEDYLRRKEAAMRAREMLKTKYLRLKEDQVKNLEKDILAIGEELPAHVHKTVTDIGPYIFGHDPKLKENKERVSLQKDINDSFRGVRRSANNIFGVNQPNRQVSKNHS